MKQQNQSDNFIGRKGKILLSVLSFMIVCLLIFVIFGRTPAGHLPETSPSVNPTNPVSPPTEDPYGYTEMTLLSVGDIMFHNPQIVAGLNAATQTYDFNDNFQYVKSLVSGADLAVGNFEGTIAETGFKGYPVFHLPVATLEAVKGAGFDVMLFANNHMYDNQKFGVQNTLTKFKELGFAYAGATLDTEKEPSCLVQEVKGIKIGILNYADSLTQDIVSNYTGELMHTINGIAIQNDFFNNMNIYVQGQEDAFYARVAADMAYLKAQKVDIVVTYIHWGWEYHLTENEYQRQTAQKLCDMGVDVIIGSHPHVIQPMDTLVSTTDPSHSTLCFYSLGNYLSNQNRVATTWSSEAPRKGYSENGLTVELTIRRYNNGETLVSKLDYTPTWVHRYYESGKLQFNILPLPIAEDQYAAYGLTKSSHGVAHAIESFQRTNDAMKDDVAAYNQNAIEVMAKLEGKA